MLQQATASGSSTSAGKLAGDGAKLAGGRDRDGLDDDAMQATGARWKTKLEHHVVGDLSGDGGASKNSSRRWSTGSVRRAELELEEDGPRSMKRGIDGWSSPGAAAEVTGGDGGRERRRERRRRPGTGKP